MHSSEYCDFPEEVFCSPNSQLILQRYYKYVEKRSCQFVKKTELLFLELFYNKLVIGGQAAVVVPAGAIFTPGFFTLPDTE